MYHVIHSEHVGAHDPKGDWYHHYRKAYKDRFFKTLKAAMEYADTFPAKARPIISGPYAGKLVKSTTV